MTATALFDLPDTREAEAAANERKAEARKHFDIILKAEEMVSVSSMRIGWHAYYLKRNNLFGILGFANEHEAAKAAGVSDSTWYANIRLAESFSGLDEEQFISMKQGNAKALADLPESKRMSRKWIRAASSKKHEEFLSDIDVEMEGVARASEGKEQGVVLKMPMPISRKKVVEEGLKEYAEKVGVVNGDIGKAMELMVVEQRDQVSLVQVITNATQRIKAAWEWKKSNLSAEETVEKLYAMLDEILLEFAAGVNGLQNLESSKEEA